MAFVEPQKGVRVVTPTLLVYVLVAGEYRSLMLSTQQLMAGGRREGTESHSVNQSLVLSQYQCFVDGLDSFASS